MRGGRLRHRLDLQHPVTTIPSDDGVPVTTFETVTQVWGSIDAVAGREGVSDKKVLAESTHEIRIRAYADIDPTWRIAFKTRIFRIVDLRRPAERQVEIIIYVSEEVA